MVRIAIKEGSLIARYGDSFRIKGINYVNGVYVFSFLSFRHGA